MLTRSSRFSHSVRLLGCLCAIIVCLVAGVCAPATRAASAGGGSAFSELTEGGQEASTATTASTPTESSTSGSNSNTGTVLVLGLIAAAVLLGGIAFLIMRDAHRVAPVPEGQVSGSGRPARDPAVTMRKRRAKAKAARAQRKRNR